MSDFKFKDTSTEQDKRRGIFRMTMTFQPWWVVVGADAKARVKHVLFPGGESTPPSSPIEDNND